MGPRKNDWLVSQKEKFQNSKIFVSFLFLRKKLIKFKLNQACKKNRSKAIIVLIILPQPLLLIPVNSNVDVKVDVDVLNIILSRNCLHFTL